MSSPFLSPTFLSTSSVSRLQLPTGSLWWVPNQLGKSWIFQPKLTTSQKEVCLNPRVFWIWHNSFKDFHKTLCFKVSQFSEFHKSFSKCFKLANVTWRVHQGQGRKEVAQVRRLRLTLESPPENCASTKVRPCTRWPACSCRRAPPKKKMTPSFVKTNNDHQCGCRYTCNIWVNISYINYQYQYLSINSIIYNVHLVKRTHPFFQVPLNKRVFL